MRFSIEAKAMLLVLACLFAAVFLVQFWHSAPAIVIGNAGFALIEYPKIVYSDSNACFSLEYYFPSNNLRASLEMQAKSSNVLVSATEQIRHGRNSFQKKYCFPASKLEDGNNLVEISSLATTLFFHVEKKSFAEPKKPGAELEINSIENSTVNFSVSIFDSEKIVPIEIFVNSKLDHRVFPENARQNFSEKISLESGKNLVELKLGGISVQKEIENPALPSMPVLVGIPLLVLAFCVFVFFVFSSQGFFGKIALSIASVFVVSIILGFVLGRLKLLSLFSFLFCFIIILVVLAFFFRKNFSQSFPKIGWLKLNAVFVLAVAFFFVVPLFFQVFTSTHITYWNGFYERSSAAIAESFSIPVEDSLGYFGRGFSAVPGYFFLNAGVSWVTGLGNVELFSVLLLLSNLLLFFGTMFFADSLKLSDNKKALFIIFVALDGFLVSAITYSPRHVFALAFFLLGVGLLVSSEKRNWLLAGLFLGIMAFIQAPLLLFLPVFYLIVSKKIEWKKMIKATLLAGFVFFVLFLPNLLQFGMVKQAQSGEWGYLINYSPYYLFLDIVVLIAFFIIFFAPDFLRRKLSLTRYNLKLLLGLVFGVVLQLTLVYRWNLLTAANLALLIAVFFPEKSLSDRVSARLLGIILLICTAFVLYAMAFENIHEIVLQPIAGFLGKNTESNSKILSDPMYGHVIAFAAKRAVLADLQVEYADEQKLLDAYKFLEDKDYNVISKYGIDYTVNQVDFVHRQAIGAPRVYGIIEFKKFDKIFSNGFIFVHRVRKENFNP